MNETTDKTRPQEDTDGEPSNVAETKEETGGRKTRGARPRNKPFDQEERQHLCGLAAVNSCTEKRITWNREFIGRVQSEIEAGGHPTEIFRKAGVGPEVIGRKRIERCVARWREKARREKKEDNERQGQ